MSRTVFTGVRWATGVATLLVVTAMLTYPGGTFLDHSSSGYAFFHNFLSDLGMTTAHDGQPNKVAAVLFVVSLVLGVAAFVACLVGFIRLYSESPRARWLSRAAAAVGLVVCAAFVGVAATPEDKLLELHITVTLLAFRIFPFVSVLLFLASISSATIPRRVAVGWAALSVVLIGYVILLGWGPSLRTPQGLVVYVTAQKIVAATCLISMTYLSFQADRIRDAARQSA